MLYRLYTEDKGDLITLVGRYFDGATIIPARGLWDLIAEKSVVIDIITALPEDNKVEALVFDIKFFNHQESVLVVAINETHKFI